MLQVFMFFTRCFVQAMPVVFDRQRGATMVEYALILGLIAVVAIAVITGIGGNVNTLFDEANTALGNATN